NPIRKRINPQWRNRDYLRVGAGPPEVLLIHAVLLGVRNHGDLQCFHGSLPCHGCKTIDGDQDTAGGISECLGRHNADAEAGITAGSSVDDEALNVPWLS